MDDQVAKAKAQKKTNALFVLACARGYLDDVKGLLEKGADPQSADKRNVSALHYACGQGRLEVLKFLWTRGIELDAEDPDGNLPLHYAVRSGKLSVVKYLLEKGAWVEGSDSRDETPLHVAARKGQEEIAKLLLDNGAKATLKDVNKRGLTALGEAISAGNEEVARLLIKAGADIKVRPRGWSLLQLAASQGRHGAVKLLLDSGADIKDAANSDEATALHCAALSGDLTTAKLLVDAGADLAAADASNKQPKDVVPEGKPELKKLLHTSKPAKAISADTSRAAPRSDAEEFRALSEKEQLARIDRWSEAADMKQLESTLLEFPLELKTQLTELHRLRQIYNIQQAVVSLLEDDDFQELANKPGAQEVVAQVHTDKSAFTRYAEDRDTMALLRALQRFQAVVRANGGHQIPFQSLLRTAEPGYQEKSSMRLKGMQLMLGARRRAALAAALSETEAEAKEKAAQELDLEKQRKAPPLSARSPADEIQPAEALEGVSNDTLRRPFTWKGFMRELLKSVVNNLLIMAVILCVSYLVLGRFPWQVPEGSPPTEGATPSQEL